MQVKIYHNPRCGKSRKAKAFLEEHNIEYEEFLYLEETFTEDDLRDILAKGNLSVSDIVRTNEDEYKEHVKGKDLDDSEILKLIVRYPKMLQRPIIVNDKKAVVARDDESLEEVLSW